MKRKHAEPAPEQKQQQPAPLINLLARDPGGIILDYVGDHYKPILRATCRWLNKRIVYGEWSFQKAVMHYFQQGQIKLICYTAKMWNWTPEVHMLFVAAKHGQWQFFTDEIMEIIKNEPIVRLKLAKYGNYDLALRCKNALPVEAVLSAIVTRGELEHLALLTPKLDQRAVERFWRQDFRNVVIGKGLFSVAEWAAYKGHWTPTPDDIYKIANSSCYLRRKRFDEFYFKRFAAMAHRVGDACLTEFTCRNMLDLVQYLCEHNLACTRTIATTVGNIVHTTQSTACALPAMEYLVSELRRRDNHDVDSAFFALRDFREGEMDTSYAKPMECMPIRSVRAAKLTERIYAKHDTHIEARPECGCCLARKECDGPRESCMCRCECEALAVGFATNAWPHLHTSKLPILYCKHYKQLILHAPDQIRDTLITAVLADKETFLCDLNFSTAFMEEFQRYVRGRISSHEYLKLSEFVRANRIRKWARNPSEANAKRMVHQRSEVEHKLWGYYQSLWSLHYESS